LSSNGNANHKRLMIPGPVEVRKEILDAQTEWMIGHRSTAFADLFARLQDKLKQVYLTDSRVFVQGSSGTGLWEGASRNCIRDGKKVLHLVGGAFSERWAEISQLNGKEVDVITVDWGQAHTPEMVEDALKKAAEQGITYDALCVVHNETSTGVINPIKDMAAVARQYDDTLVLVDTVSGFLGAELRVDEWGIDMALTSSQKAFALPPGIAFTSISDRVLARAAEVKNRGYYFDFIEIEASLKKNNTPSTPPISLMYAADKQLDDILAEGLENRWNRHLNMRSITHQWANERGFGIFAQKGYESPTVSAVDNREKGINVDDLAKFMNGRMFSMDKGYGKIKGKTFRIAHMGDMQIDTLEEFLSGLDDFLAQ
jgi:aspartate aminotransferase-like enzyme